MPRFIHEDFLLRSEFARRLYHESAKNLPIVDYHNHLSPELIATNHQFRSLSELWLDGDHYKWRAMRAAGESERCITGSANDWERFEAWARVVPDTLRNPLFHWTHLELAFPFGISDRLLCPTTARGIFDACNESLKQPHFSTRGLLTQYNVESLCTTDDPVDSLAAHIQVKNEAAIGFRLLPTWRPDRAFSLSKPDKYNEWILLLEETTNSAISNLTEFLDALMTRHDFFHSVGCRLSDHGLDRMVARTGKSDPEASFKKIRTGAALTVSEQDELKFTLLIELARMDHEKGWVQQFHIGALRNTNTRLLKSLGPNTGFDSIDDCPVAAPLALFLDELDSTGQLAKTILYNLNPRDNDVFATMIGNFQDGSAPGKMQYGSAWWFLDQLDGIERQLNSLSNMGLLARFVGMLTDSRSFVSFSRHEYFRRILCNMLGQDVERGHLPRDLNLLKGLVEGVCYKNAKEYFSF